MSTPETLVENFIWMPWQEDKIIAFLQDKAAKGWIVKDWINPHPIMLWKPYGFVFEKKEPKNLIYRSDYSPGNKDKLSEYFQLCEDAGWHHACTVKSSHFFYADAETADRADFFSDTESKIAKYGRLQRRTMILGAIFIPAMYYLYYYSWLAHNTPIFRDSPFNASMIVLLAVFYLYILARLNLVIGHIKRQSTPRKKIKWRFWYDVAIVLSLTLALTPVFGFLLIPGFHWGWGWYFQNTFFVSFWTIFMVLFFAWMNRRGKKEIE